jgi:hypothetical protein
MTALAAGALAFLSSSGCYRYAFELAPPPPTGQATVTYVDHPPTFLNGFIGKGRVDAERYCAHPIRTALKVGVMDVLVSVATLLIYTPHTLEVTCPVSETAKAAPDPADPGRLGRLGRLGVGPRQSPASTPPSRFR